MFRSLIRSTAAVTATAKNRIAIAAPSALAVRSAALGVISARRFLSTAAAAVQTPTPTPAASAAASGASGSKKRAKSKPSSAAAKAAKEAKRAGWSVTIGIEMHAQIISQTKLFSGSATVYPSPPNQNASFIDAAFPGTLPVGAVHPRLRFVFCICR